MPFGVLTGLTAALFWGTLDVITALTSRVIGSLRVTAGMQSVTALMFIAIFLATGTKLPTEPSSFGLALLLGFVGAGAYLSYFTGLQFGPIAVVSGMVAAFGGLTVVLAVVLRGESLTPLQAVGARSRRSASCSPRSPSTAACGRPGSPVRESSSRSSPSSSSRSWRSRSMSRSRP